MTQKGESEPLQSGSQQDRITSDRDAVEQLKENFDTFLFPNYMTSMEEASIFKNRYGSMHIIFGGTIQHSLLGLEAQNTAFKLKNPNFWKTNAVEAVD